VILVDTSAWVEYDRHTGSPADRRLAELIAHDDQIAVTEPIVMEVVAAARDERWADQLRRLLARFELLPVDPVADFEGATRIHRHCTAAGIAPRGMLDCMVAAVAWRRGATLLAHDADLDRVARLAGVAVDRASLRAPPSSLPAR
jgi:predicted nucleic acid-binding protein